MPRLFGTNGVRGIANREMTGEFALKLGMAIGTFFQRGRYVIGTDTRTSNQLLKNAVTAGLLSVGGDMIDVGIVPSPVLQYAVKIQEVQAGVMITASHNPPEFNGIKVIGGDGTELGRNTEKEIEDIFFDNRFQVVQWDAIGGIKEWDASPGYHHAVISQVKTENIVKRKFRVVLDCGNGAGARVFPGLLRNLGCEVIPVYCTPDGLFPGRNPEPTRENIGELLQVVQREKADLGVAFDGDADRAVFVDEKGGYLDGDKTLALFARHLISRGDICVTPVSSSSCVSDVVHDQGGTVVYTRVGAPIVARRMIEVSAAFGGEENGGLIFPGHQYCRDGGMAAAAMLDLLADSQKSLTDIVSDLPQYVLYKEKISCPDDKKRGVMEALMKKYRENSDLTDGIKIFLPGGWVLVRPSGTEPLIRVFAEAQDETTARDMAKEYIREITEILR